MQWNVEHTTADLFHIPIITSSYARDMYSSSSDGSPAERNDSQTCILFRICCFVYPGHVVLYTLYLFPE